MSALPPWTDTTLIRVDKEGDHRRASNGWSRYASYVMAREKEFWEWGNSDQPLPPNEFAAVAWRIATSPVMSPGYAEIRPDLNGLKLMAGSDQLTIRVNVPLPHGDLRQRLPYQWRDWERVRTWTGGDGDWYAQYPPEPEPGRPPVVTVAARIEYAQDWQLLAPTHTTGKPLVQDAIGALDVLIPQINTVIGPMVRDLLHGERA